MLVISYIKVFCHTWPADDGLIDGPTWRTTWSYIMAVHSGDMATLTDLSDSDCQIIIYVWEGSGSCLYGGAGFGHFKLSLWVWHLLPEFLPWKSRMVLSLSELHMPQGLSGYWLILAFSAKLSPSPLLSSCRVSDRYFNIALMKAFDKLSIQNAKWKLFSIPWELFHSPVHLAFYAISAFWPQDHSWQLKTQNTPCINHLE